MVKFVLTNLCVGHVKVKEIAGANASISALEFSSTSSTLAVGNEFGLVRMILSSICRFLWKQMIPVLACYAITHYCFAIMQVFLYQLDRTHDKSGLPLITQKQREGPILLYYFVFLSWVSCLCFLFMFLNQFAESLKTSLALCGRRLAM